MVLWEKIGPGSHPCHWCGHLLVWMHGLSAESLQVDHLDEDRANNDPTNLVPSCHTCNKLRSRPKGAGGYCSMRCVYQRNRTTS